VCASGKEHLCAQEEWTIVGRNGGMGRLVRADARFMVPIPNGIASADAAPLMCAGTTVFSPLIHCGFVSTMRAAVVGRGRARASCRAVSRKAGLRGYRDLFDPFEG